jgi:HEXXH motif-containing protein
VPAHDLTLPESTATMRRIVSGVLRKLAQELPRLRPRASAGVSKSFASVQGALVEELRRDPGRAFSVLRRPNVGTLARVVRDLPGDAPRERVDELTSQLACTLAIELAASGAELPPMAFARSPAQIVSHGARAVFPGGGPATMRDGTWSVGDRTYDVRAPRGVARPFHTVDGAIVLAIADDNPLAMLEAHPDKRGNAIDLGGRAIDDWLASLRDAIGRVGRYLPIVREEMELVLQQIVPVGADDEKHLSASYGEAIGTIYLTLHPNAMTMTEAVVHELSHNKLNALLELEPLLENAYSPLFGSPVRPDPRPLHGVLLAVHAFLPVATLYRAMIDADDPLAQREPFRDRLRQIARGNHEGMGVLLENARPTEAGRALLDELARIDASFEDARAD